MQAGKLRHYVTVQTYEATGVDNRGNRTGAWEPLFEKVPCEIVTLAGKELEMARAIVAQANVKIRMRYLPGLSARHQITWQGRTFHIGAIDNVEQRNRELVLTCVEDKGD